MANRAIQLDNKSTRRFSMRILPLSVLKTLFAKTQFFPGGAFILLTPTERGVAGLFCFRGRQESGRCDCNMPDVSLTEPRKVSRKSRYASMQANVVNANMVITG